VKRIAVLVTARPSWAKLLPICEALQPNFELDVIAAAYAVTHNRSGVVDSMIADGFTPTTVLAGALDGNTLETSVLTRAS
jgi:UDP-N-acetylglucosamine 2-epimerase